MHDPGADVETTAVLVHDLEQYLQDAGAKCLDVPRRKRLVLATDGAGTPISEK